MKFFFEQCDTEYKLVRQRKENGIYKDPHVIQLDNYVRSIFANNVSYFKPHITKGVIMPI